MVGCFQVQPLGFGSEANRAGTTNRMRVGSNPLSSGSQRILLSCRRALSSVCIGGAYVLGTKAASDDNRRNEL